MKPRHPGARHPGARHPGARHPGAGHLGAGGRAARAVQPWALAALAACLPGIVSGLRENKELFEGGLLNPDSAMRLVRLDDILAAGQPLHAVLRDGSGAGSIMSWSHLLDSLLLLLAAPGAPWLGWHTALHWAGLASGPLCMAGLGVAVAWAARPAIGTAAARSWLWVGAFAAGTAPAIATYGQLGVVHHHVALVAVAVAAAGWALRLLLGERPLAGGIALGAWAAAGLWLSPEALPFALLAVGAVWVGWFTAPGGARARALATALLSACASFALLATLAWLVDPPSGGLLANEPDRLSLPFVLLGAAALATAAVTRAASAAVPRRMPVLAAGAVLAGAWLAAFPQVLHGTAGLMSAEDAQAFFGDITEMQPLRDAGSIVEGLLGGVFAMLALLAGALRTRGPDRAGRVLPLLYAAGCVAGLMLLAALHRRFAAYPAAAGAVMLPIVLAAIEAAPWRPGIQAAARLAVLALLLAGPPSATIAVAAAAPAAAGAMPCPIAGAVGLLANRAGAVVLGNVNDTPELLYRTRVRTVGSLYHRNPGGFLRQRAAWTAIPNGTPSPAFRATAATLVLSCPGEPRDAPNGPQDLHDRLIDDRPPAWLRRLADAGPGGYVLYAITAE